MMNTQSFPDRIRQELYNAIEYARKEQFASMIMSNFASRIASQAIVQNRESNIHEYGVNMKMRIYLCQEFLRTENRYCCVGFFFIIEVSIFQRK